MGFRRFLYRGKEKVGGEWSLVCAAFNIRKMGALLRGKGRPANPKRFTHFFFLKFLRLLSSPPARLIPSVGPRAFTAAPPAQAA
jgi:hypothetical protein